MQTKRLILYVGLFICLFATEAFANEGHEPRWGDFGYRVVNFILFFGILWYFTGKLVKKYFKGRRQEIQDTFDNLDARKVQAKQKLAEVEAHIANLEQERKAILDESRQQAEALKARIIEDAKRQAEQIVAQAKLSAENEGRSLLAQVRSTMADEIVDAAEKLLREKLGTADHKKLINNSLKVVLN
ncbi:MAG: ATP synthase F0 subunit B [Desulfovibrionaceae bacterium]|nr:ATP synthase F0 subunit B [Desulfovibrionaceae bacterium]